MLNEEVNLTDTSQIRSGDLIYIDLKPPNWKVRAWRKLARWFPAQWVLRRALACKVETITGTTINIERKEP